MRYLHILFNCLSGFGWIIKDSDLLCIREEFSEASNGLKRADIKGYASQVISGNGKSVRVKDHAVDYGSTLKTVLCYHCSQQAYCKNKHRRMPVDLPYDPA